MNKSVREHQRHSTHQGNSCACLNAKGRKDCQKGNSGAQRDRRQDHPEEEEEVEKGYVVTDRCYCYYFTEENRYSGDQSQRRFLGLGRSVAKHQRTILMLKKREKYSRYKIL